MSLTFVGFFFFFFDSELSGRKEGCLPHLPLFLFRFGPGVVYDAAPKIMYQQFGFFRFGLDAKKYVSYASQIQDETVDYIAAKWGSEGTRCIFSTLNELFTLTSARCLLGPEIRALWKEE